MGGCDYQTRLQTDITQNRFSEGDRGVQIIYTPGHWQLLTREGRKITFYCSLGQSLTEETQRVIGHLMGLSEGTRLELSYGVCQKQKGLNCGVHAIAMAVCFALGHMISEARFSHELLRGHLVECYEKQNLSEFPKPTEKEKGKIAVTGKETRLQIRIPKLCINLFLAVLIQKRRNK